MNSETASTTSVVDPAPIAPATKVSHHTGAPKDDSSRCLHRYANGRRCSLPGPKDGFCLRHFQSNVAAGLPLIPAPSDFEDLSADLLPQPSEFDAALSVNQFLSRLLVLVTKGRVTPRRAAVMAYITNQILHSHRAIDREFDSEPQQIIFDLPRPKRDLPEDPERAMYKHLSGGAAAADSDRWQPHTGVARPTPAEVYVPGHNPPDSGNGAPK